MAKGWIRAYGDEFKFFQHNVPTRKERSFFRMSFETFLFESADENSAQLKTLRWGDEFELPEGIGSNSWVRAIVDGTAGFVKRWHAVEVGFLAKNSENTRSPFVTRLEFKNTTLKKDLVWGDLIQIRKRENGHCLVRARGFFGSLPEDRITEQPLLNIYFIDVGQGDGVLIRFPEGKHMLIDGGLPRANQQTGKNAADFVDWKFFFDYGHYKIHLDSMMASHCDKDHYGGLWDLIDKDPETDLELDCIRLTINDFHHAGLSTWVDKDDTHKNNLGPTKDGWFTKLLDDRDDAIACIDKNNTDTLKGHWKSFIKDILEQYPQTTFIRVGVRGEDLEANLDFPQIYPNESECEIKVLAPVTFDVEGKPALKDLGSEGINKNGHSICLRLDYGNARILLTGDLNTASMNYISEAYGDHMDSFNSDVAKACHHGSHDISYKFLKHINAGATIISSGDAEGHAHPRPEIVAASALTGHINIDEDKDRLITPLIYMTEIERSVSLGKLTHIRVNNFSDGDGIPSDRALLALDRNDIKNTALLTTEERKKLKEIEDEDEAIMFKNNIIERENELLNLSDTEIKQFNTSANYHYKLVHELFSISYKTKPIKRSRILNKNHYGLVTVRTDGETIMCATLKEEGSGWTVHSFDARF